MGEALQQYHTAYKIAPGNWRSAHCIGSWYRKQALKHFYPDSLPQNLAEKQFFHIQDKQIELLSGEEREELIQQLKRAVYLV